MWGAMALVHLTARMVWPHACFEEFDASSWFWARLRDNFPMTYASLPMPNHPHVLCEVESPEAARAALARTCGHLQRRLGMSRLWEPVPAAQVIADAGKARRMARYIVLNASRAGLVGDPLAWTWSTHRDVVGATADPWVDVDRMAGALGLRPDSFRVDFHRYCSSDPSASVSGTRFPELAPARDLPVDPLGTIARAAAVATRGAPDDITRRTPTRYTFLALADHQGWRDTGQLARACGTTTQAVGRALTRGVPPHALDAARMCLDDARLLDSAPSNARFAGLRSA